MRNLKKVLSLALALVMLIGMMVVGAGAATKFQDDAEIQNQEAVAVLVGMGIMKGRGDGTNFEPAGTLTRAEAAKMIAQLDLGVEAADALKGNGTSPFSDVWSGYWAEGAIDYCVEQGYITGDGAGHFFPSRNVSSVEFGIMLLRLLGYDAKIEGLVGDQWATKGAALARKAGLTTSVAANTQPMTRDAMAQMAFNVLTATLVEYNGLNVSIGDATFNTPASPRYHNANDLGIKNETYDGKVPTATTTIKFCEEHFPDLKLDTGSRDNFKREYSVWTWKKVDIAGSKVLVKADSEFTAWTSTSDVSSAINGAKGGALYVNGKPYSDAEINALVDKKTDGVVNAAVINALSDNGRQILVYLKETDHTAIEKVVVVDTYPALVSAVSSANGTITLTQRGQNKPSLDSRTVKATGFEVGDVVSYNAYWNDKNYTISGPEALEVSTTGTLTKWVGDNVLENDTTKGDAKRSFTVDNGDPFEYSRNNAVVDSDGAESSITNFGVNKSEINVYLDKYNYAIYVSGIEVEKNYAAVIGMGQSNQYGSETRGVTLLLPDNTTVEVTAKMDDWSVMTKQTTGTNAGKNLVTDGLADIVTYTVDSKGIYTLSLVAHPNHSTNVTGGYDVITNVGTDKVEFVNGKSRLTISGQNFYTTSKTVFMVATNKSSTNTDKVYNVYTGYANAPSTKTGGVVGIAYGLNKTYNNQIDVVYIDATEMDGVNAAYTYFVLNTAKHKVTTDSTGKYFTVPAIVDGEVTTVKIDAGLNAQWIDGKAKLALDKTDKGLYTIDRVKVDENNIIVDCEPVPAATAFRATVGEKVGTIRPNGEVLGFNNGRDGKDEFWAYTADTNVFYVDKDYSKITADEVKNVQTDGNDKIYADYDGTTAVDTSNKRLTDVIIVEQDGDEPAGPKPDTYTITVKVDGTEDKSKSVSDLSDGDKRTITYTVPVNKTATYKVGTDPVSKVYAAGETMEIPVTINKASVVVNITTLDVGVGQFTILGGKVTVNYRTVGEPTDKLVRFWITEENWPDWVPETGALIKGKAHTEIEGFKKDDIEDAGNTTIDLGRGEANGKTVQVPNALTASTVIKDALKTPAATAFTPDKVKVKFEAGTGTKAAEVVALAAKDNKDLTITTAAAGTEFDGSTNKIVINTTYAYTAATSGGSATAASGDIHVRFTGATNEATTKVAPLILATNGAVVDSTAGTSANMKLKAAGDDYVTITLDTTLASVEEKASVTFAKVVDSADATGNTKIDPLSANGVALAKISGAPTVAGVTNLKFELDGGNTAVSLTKGQSVNVTVKTSSAASFNAATIAKAVNGSLVVTLGGAKEDIVLTIANDASANSASKRIVIDESTELFIKDVKVVAAPAIKSVVVLEDNGTGNVLDAGDKLLVTFEEDLDGTTVPTVTPGTTSYLTASAAFNLEADGTTKIKNQVVLTLSANGAQTGALEIGLKDWVAADGVRNYGGTLKITGAESTDSVTIGKTLTVGK